MNLKKFLFKIKGLLGLLLLIGLGVGVFYWESYGREMLIYQDVVVLSRDVEKNTLITSDMVTWVKRNKEALIENPILNPNDIIGLEAKHFIPKNSQLSHRFFDEPILVLNKDEIIFKIPNDWIKAYPLSLRRKDTAYLFPIKASQQEEVDYSSFTVNTIDKESLYKMVIAYVKDSANKEVVSIIGNRSNGSFVDERLDGSSNIASIEVITTVKQVNEIKRLRESGYDFIILYQD